MLSMAAIDCFHPGHSSRSVIFQFSTVGRKSSLIVLVIKRPTYGANDVYFNRNKVRELFIAQNNR